VTTLQTIFHRYGPAYRAHCGDTLPPHHRRAMAAIEACRTEALGGQVFSCPRCATTRYQYHSCRNRHCPTCQQDATQAWLTQQTTRLLPVPYFLVTFTLPARLRAVARAYQRQLYDCLFRASAAALQQLASDPRLCGGQLGMVGVLQTWTRDLRYHPHIHYLIPAVGLAPDGTVVLPPHPNFLLPARPLAALFRGKLRAALCQTPAAPAIPVDVWRQDWVVDCRPVGQGDAALKYLAPYIFRVALSNNRILALEGDLVTFQYTQREPRARRTCTLPAEAFIHRFLQHVLPNGFVKVRYYGLLRAGNRTLLNRVRAQLVLRLGQASSVASTNVPPTPERWREPPVCLQCGGPMWCSVIHPQRGRSPPPPSGRCSTARGPGGVS
jgi:hypothetical protein